MTTTWTTRTEQTPVAVALGLGSNAGSREQHLIFAIRSLAALLDNLSISSPYLTQPLHQHSQRSFLNAAVVGHCACDAEELMAVTKGLEWRAGRRPGNRWGPRPLDIDLLLIDGLCIQRPELTVPHPRLAERRFVLAPLNEIAPAWRVPPRGQTVSSLLAVLGEGQPIEPRSWSSVPIPNS